MTTLNKLFYTALIVIALLAQSCGQNNAGSNKATNDKAAPQPPTPMPEGPVDTSLKNQTPINMQRDSSAEQSPVFGMQFAFTPLAMKVSIDTSHGDRYVNLSIHPDAVTDDNVMRIDGAKYRLAKFHFHRPGEHKFEGRPCDMEMHLVFQSVDKPDSTVVIGLPVFAIAAKNEFISKLWLSFAAALKTGKDQTVDVDLNNFDAENASLDKYIQKYWTYPGSLTTPSYGKVGWIVSDSFYVITPRQLEQFESLAFKGKYPIGPARGIQPIGDRKVLRSFK